MIIRVTLNAFYVLESFAGMHMTKIGDEYALCGNLGHGETTKTCVLTTFPSSREARVCFETMIDDYERGKKRFDLMEWKRKWRENVSSAEDGIDELTMEEKLNICKDALSDSKARELKLEQDNRNLTMEIYLSNEGLKENIKARMKKRKTDDV